MKPKIHFSTAAMCFLLVIGLAACNPEGRPTASPTAPPATQTPAQVSSPPPTHPPAPAQPAGPTPLATQPVPASPTTASPTPPVVRSQVQRYTCLWADQAQNTPVYTFEVIQPYAHDPNAYTQGLIFRDGFLYEGTGLYGQSSLRKVRLENGEVTQMIPLPEQYFGEGITELDGKIFQLTWKEQTGFIYSLADFAQLATFSYPTEGWGLTHDGNRLLMSDGSEFLYYLDPETTQTVSQVMVSAEGIPVPRLNELEYVDGEVWANVYQTACIARIDPVSGQVLGWIDLSGILPMKDLPGSEVPNGIAYDPAGGRLFVTGKYWPKLFEIRLVKQSG